MKEEINERRKKLILKQAARRPKSSTIPSEEVQKECRHKKRGGGKSGELSVLREQALNEGKPNGTLKPDSGAVETEKVGEDRCGIK